MALVDLKATDLFTIQDGLSNDPNMRDIASVAEVQVKPILAAGLEECLWMRTSATASSFSQFGDFATGIFRIPQRSVIGTDYDFKTGSQVQTSKSSNTEVYMDQLLTGTFTWETFDTSRWCKAPHNIKGEMVSAWLFSITQSLLLSLEAIFIRGIVDYVTAMGNKRPDHLISADPAQITDDKSVRDFYNMIQTKIILPWRKQFTPTTFGIKQDSVQIAISLDLYNQFVTHMSSFVITPNTFEILGTGSLVDKKILGTDTQTHNMLQNKFMAGTGSSINKDLNFDFSNVSLIAYNRDSICMPVGMQQTMTLLDNNTGNPKLIMKNMVGLPCVLRPDYVAVGFIKMPTSSDILAAQGRVGDGIDHSFAKSFQLAKYDHNFGNPTQIKK